VSAILDILFPKRKKAAPTSTEIAAEIERHNALLADARSRLDATAQKRTAARDGLNAAGMTAADNEAAGIRNEIEVAEMAIGALKVEHADRVKIEERERFRADVAIAEREAVALAATIQDEYPDLAQRLGALLTRMARHRANATRLWERGRELREPFGGVSGVEGFRAAPQRWRVTWRGESGEHVVGSPEDAPRGSIRWVGGEPVAAREGVVVEPRRIDAPPSLLEEITHLPGLLHGEAAVYYAPKPTVLPPRMPI